MGHANRSETRAWLTIFSLALRDSNNMRPHPRFCTPPVRAAALQDPPTRCKMNAESRISLIMAGGGFTAAHYVQAQKIRTRVEAHFR